jgi:hypothetical protein
MHRLMIAFLLFLPALSPAAAEEYRNDEAGYRVTLPAGWTKNNELSGTEGTIFESPRVTETLGVCLIASEATPQTRNASQAELDASLAGQFTSTFWSQAFADMKGVTIETAGEETQSGRKVYFAVLTYQDEAARLKVKGVLHVVPGQMHILYCGAEYSAYPQEEPDMEAFLKSFTPAGPELVVSAPPYARPVVGRRPLMNEIFEEVRAGAHGLKAATARKPGKRR